MAILTLIQSAYLPSGNVWHFQANDDTRGGWLAVGIYAVLTILCWRKVARQNQDSGSHQSRLSATFWIALSLGVTALGINKQLDLQTLLIQISRGIAQSEGLFEYRRYIELGFFIVVAVLTALVVLYLWRLGRRVRGSERTVVIGTAALMGFVFLRTASAGKVVLIGGRFGGHRPILVLEILILTFLCYAAARDTHSSG